MIRRLFFQKVAAMITGGAAASVVKDLPAKRSPWIIEYPNWLPGRVISVASGTSYIELNRDRFKIDYARIGQTIRDATVHFWKDRSEDAHPLDHPLDLEHGYLSKTTQSMYSEILALCPRCGEIDFGFNITVIGYPISFTACKDCIDRASDLLGINILEIKDQMDKEREDLVKGTT